MFSPFRRKIFRAPDTAYTHEFDSALSIYNDERLAGIRAYGFDSIWLRGVLRELVRTEVFPELAPRSDQYLAVLNALTARCRKHGLGVLLYMNEPLGFPTDDPFWTHHPDARGESGSSPDDGWDHSNALCTSTDPVRAFLYQGSRNLFRAVPDLAGAFLITATEHHTHCYSHHDCRNGVAGFRCPRCGTRTPAEVIGEIVALIQKGARESNPSAEIIAWNWSWMIYEADPQADIIHHLPEGATLLADFERGGRRHISLNRDTVHIDREIEIDEYSLVYVGPSPRFMGTFRAAHDRGVPCYAKLQLGTTHEIATVPNIPLIPNLYRKFQKMHEIGVEGFLGCWNFGNDPSLNIFAAGKLFDHVPPDERGFLHAVAEEYFPGCRAEGVVAAWYDFCHAMEMHPFSHPFIYFAPVNWAVVHPWRLDPPSRPLEPTWYIRDDHGDKLEQSCGPFSMIEVEQMLGELVDRWAVGLTKLEAGLAPAEQGLHVIQELAVARMIGHQFRSTRNIFRFHRLRGAWLADKNAATTEAWKFTVREEIDNLRACLPSVEADPRLGIHQGSFPGPHRYYDAPRIRQQIVALEKLAADRSIISSST